MGATASKVSVLKVTIDATPTALIEVRSFSIETSLGTIDASTLSTDWKKFLAGQASWSGSIECFYDPEDAAQAELLANGRIGTECTITVQPLGAGAGKTQLSGKCIITNSGISCSSEEAVTVSISFQGNGELSMSADAS